MKRFVKNYAIKVIAFDKNDKIVFNKFDKYNSFDEIVGDVRYNLKNKKLPSGAKVRLTAYQEQTDVFKEKNIVL